MKEVLVGAGQIGMTIARRMGYEKKIVLGDRSIKNAEDILKIQFMRRMFNLAVLLVLCIAGVHAQTTKNKKTMRSIIVYYSRPGNNYVNGDIVNLKVGNTRVVAEKIQKLTGVDLFSIDPVKPYPEDYRQCTEVVKKELDSNAHPAYKGDVKNWDEYDTIYLGYPNWWGTMPMVVLSFLEKHNLTGKTILPFCTHEGSAMGNSEADLKKSCPKATIKKGLAVKGSTVANADKSISQWIKNNQ